MMQTPNEVTAIVAAIALCLCAYLLRGALRDQNDSSALWFARSVQVISLAIFCRLMTWDMVIGTAVWIWPEFRNVFGVIGNWVNSGLNLAVVFAVYCVGRAVLASIPAAERSGWTIVNIWFYPRLISFWRRK